MVTLVVALCGGFDSIDETVIMIMIIIILTLIMKRCWW